MPTPLSWLLGSPGPDAMGIILRQMCGSLSVHLPRPSSQVTPQSTSSVSNPRATPTPSQPPPGARLDSSRANPPCCLPPQARGRVQVACLKSLGLTEQVASSLGLGQGNGRLRKLPALLQFGSRRLSAQRPQERPLGSSGERAFYNSLCELLFPAASAGLWPWRE